MLRGGAAVFITMLLALVPMSLRADDGGTVTATVIPSALSVSLEAQGGNARTGSPFGLTAVVRNGGPEDVDATVHLHAAEGDLLVRDGLERDVTLRAGREQRVRWQACAEEPGAYVVMASVQAASGELLAESLAVVVEVTAKAHAHCPRGFR